MNSLSSCSEWLPPPLPPHFNYNGFVAKLVWVNWIVSVRDLYANWLRNTTCTCMHWRSHRPQHNFSLIYSVVPTTFEHWALINRCQGKKLSHIFFFFFLVKEGQTYHFRSAKPSTLLKLSTKSTYFIQYSLRKTRRPKRFLHNPQWAFLIISALKKNEPKTFL